MSQSSFAPEVTLATLGDYIKKDGTTTTTASIPFEEGLSIPHGTGSPLQIGSDLSVPGVIRSRTSISTIYTDIVGATDPGSTVSAPVLNFAGAVGTGLNFYGGGVSITGGASNWDFPAMVGGAVVMTGGRSTSPRGAAGSVVIGGGEAAFGTATTATGGSVQIYGGLAQSTYNRGYVHIGLGLATPSRIDRASDNATGSLFIENYIEVDGTAYFDSSVYLNSLTGAGILKIDANELVGVASSSDLLTAIGTIDVSANTNLAVTSPITLTGDTVGFDATANFTWTGTHSFNNTAGIALNSTSPIITFTDSTASEDDFTLSTTSNGWNIINSTDSRTAFRVDGAGTVTLGSATAGSTNVFNAATGGTHIFQVNSAEEVRIAADAMTFNNGASDVVLGWGTSGLLNITGAVTTSGTLTGNGQVIAKASAFASHASSYELSVQSNSGSAYIEILNGLGAGYGAFFGLEGSGAAGDAFALYNYQGGPILFYTDTTPSSSNKVVTITENGDVAVESGSKIYLEGTAGDTYITYNSGTGYGELWVNGNLAFEFK